MSQKQREETYKAVETQTGDAMQLLLGAIATLGNQAEQKGHDYGFIGSLAHVRDQVFRLATALNGQEVLTATISYLGSEVALIKALGKLAPFYKEQLWRPPNRMKAIRITTTASADDIMSIEQVESVDQIEYD